MNNSIKEKLIIMIIGVAILIALVAAGTYAFFSNQVENFNSVETTSRSNADVYIFTSVNTKDIEIELNFTEMVDTILTNTPVVNDTGVLEVSLLSPSSGVVTRCDYDIVWGWLDNYDKYENANGIIPFVDEESGFAYDYQFSIIIKKNGEIVNSYIGKPETDLSEFIWNENDEATILQSSSIATTKNGVKDVYEVEARMYNFPKDQSDILNKSFKGYFRINPDTSVCSLEQLSGILDPEE